MISNEDFKRLCKIDEKMLDGKPITKGEQNERIRIINEFNKEVDKAYLKNQGIM